MRFFQTLLLSLCVCSTLVVGQFGVPKQHRAAETGEASIDENGNVKEDPSYVAMAERLRSQAPIDMQDAVDVAVLLEAAQADPGTRTMVTMMKQGDQGKIVEALQKDVTPLEVVHGMKKALDELKAAEALFSEPKRAFVEMEKEGLIDKSQVQYYRENPEKLAEDTKQGLYFTFVSMAVAGGYLE